MSDNLEPEEWDSMDPEGSFRWWFWLALAAVIVALAAPCVVRRVFYGEPHAIVTQESEFSNFEQGTRCTEGSHMEGDGLCHVDTKSGTRTVCSPTDNGACCTYDLDDPEKMCHSTVVPNLMQNGAHK